MHNPGTARPPQFQSDDREKDNCDRIGNLHREPGNFKG